jgi:hypothetical protein
MKSRPFALAVLAGVVLASSSDCGGGKTSAVPTPVTTPTPAPSPVRTDLGTTNFNVRAHGSSSFNVDFPPAGVLDVTATWPGSSDIAIYATDQSCPGINEVLSGACGILGKADAPGVKPQKMSFQTASAKIYTIWTANNGSLTEPVTMTTGITTAGPIQPPPAAPTPNPNPSGTPRAYPTPTDLAPGPVTQLKAYIKSIDTGRFEYRPGEQDSAGNWIVHPGEFVVFDVTQRNGAGLICNWINDPEWSVDDPDGVLTLKDSTIPFFLRTVIEHKGHFELIAHMDGIDSNVLSVTSVANGN